MKVLGIIPARFASSRFPGKPLIDLKGKPMIQRVYEGASKSKRIHELVVATDDQRIVDAVNAFGGKAIMTSSSHPSGTDRCAEVIQHFPDVDVVINIQGDEPLVDYRQLDQLLEVFESKDTSIATLVSEQISESELHNPNRIKVISDFSNHALYFSRSAIPNTHHAKAPVTYPFLRHIGLYAYRVKTLSALTRLSPTELERTESLEQLRWLYHGFRIKLVTTDIETPNIDVPEDVQKVLDHL